jgi:type 1 glutamine amidotransferase
MKKNALFIGDYSVPNYHPAQHIDECLQKILGEQFTVTSTENYGKLSISDLEHYDLLIIYADRWDKNASKETMAAITTYAINGGGILGLHNGIIAPIEGGSPILHILGGKFDHHPDYCPLDYYKALNFKKHPIMEDFEPFTLSEEPYMFVMDPLGDREMLMEYRWNGNRYPAAWVQHYGLGHIVYMAPGHDIRTFEVPAYQKLIVKGAEWAAGIL